MPKKKGSAKYFDYGTGSAPKFAKKSKVKKPRDRKAAARKGAETRRRRKYNKSFDYGAPAQALDDIGARIAAAAGRILSSRLSK